MSEAYEKAREEHRAGGPYKSALEAINSKTYKKMHTERRKDTKNNAIKKKKGEMVWHKPDSMWESMESKMERAHEIHNKAK